MQSNHYNELIDESCIRAMVPDTLSYWHYLPLCVIRWALNTHSSVDESNFWRYILIYPHLYSFTDTMLHFNVHIALRFCHILLMYYTKSNTMLWTRINRPSIMIRRSTIRRDTLYDIRKTAKQHIPIDNFVSPVIALSIWFCLYLFHNAASGVNSLTSDYTRRHQFFSCFALSYNAERRLPRSRRGCRTLGSVLCPESSTWNNNNCCYRDTMRRHWQQRTIFGSVNL